MDKAVVRERARRAGLPNHGRPDSTGICFIGERRFREFLGHYLPAQPGPMLTPEGERIGEHAGLMYYTLGQRQGLGIGGGRGRGGEPWYVLDKDLDRNALIVGQGHDHPRLYSDGLTGETAHWIAGEAPSLPLRCRAQVRYRQKPFECTVEAGMDGGVEVHFDVPQRAVTPGQSVVFYRAERCLGGAVIAAPWRMRDAPAVPVATADIGR
jgi:tRNA-specific 2-thiouridylase